MSKRESAADAEQRDLLCENLSFAASEAYKLLRVNLKFALKQESDCPVVGVTSSTRGEGKTTTSVNLAYTLAQTGKKVLLVDGDMRLPNVARAMKISRRPGLSDRIIDEVTQNDCVRHSDILENWDIIPAGNIPPNPSELLSSEGMKKFLDEARTRYSYIVVDLPPVGIVSDALVLSEMIDGLIVVVREDYTTRKLLNNTMLQFAPLKDKLLGFVLTDVIGNSKGYGYRKRSNRKSGKAYAYGYGYDYAQEDEEEEMPRRDSRPPVRRPEAGSAPAPQNRRPAAPQERPAVRRTPDSTAQPEVRRTREAAEQQPVSRRLREEDAAPSPARREAESRRMPADQRRQTGRESAQEVKADIKTAMQEEMEAEARNPEDEDDITIRIEGEDAVEEASEQENPGVSPMSMFGENIASRPVARYNNPRSRRRT